jgi:hypothetical protein
LKNIRHHTIAITSADRAVLETLRMQIINIYKEKMEAKKGAQLVSPLVESLINNFCTFYIAPDGSKEGYDASEDGDVIRKLIIELINKLKQLDGENPVRFVEVFFGDDTTKSEIVASN